MAAFVLLISAVLAVAAAIPTSPILRKLDPVRFHYVPASDGVHLADLWASADDLLQVARYNPDQQNVYHLFTRQNPQVSQPLLIGSAGILGQTNYNAARKTVVLVHGWLDNVSSAFNAVLIPAFLQAEDVNVIAVDWSAGSGTINYAAAVTNTLTSGQGVARFISWINSATGASINNYQLIGHSLGGHQVGVIGRNLGGAIPFIVSLEPSWTGFITNDDKFRADDGLYTEVIHTNAAGLGYLSDLGTADFYPNGGINMPGCNSVECDHARAFYYMAESVISSGFLGTRCASYLTAMTGNCFLWGGLRMGGTVPKTGSSGIYYLETNAAPPFSRG